MGTRGREERWDDDIIIQAWDYWTAMVRTASITARRRAAIMDEGRRRVMPTPPLVQHDER